MEEAMSALVEFSIFPIGQGVSVAPYVARVLEVIKASGLDHELNAMGTCMEGDLDSILDVVSRCFRVLEKDCERVYATVKIDSRRGGPGRMQAKVRDVHNLLQGEAKV